VSMKLWLEPCKAMLLGASTTSNIRQKLRGTEEGCIGGYLEGGEGRGCSRVGQVPDTELAVLCA